MNKFCDECKCHSSIKSEMNYNILLKSNNPHVGCDVPLSLLSYIIIQIVEKIIINY